MLDTLIIHIPMHDEFVRKQGNLYSIIGDVADYQLRAVPSYLKRDLYTGEVTYGDLKHPFESLPSSYSNMAIKFYGENVANTKPYISLNASCKILQGHNVYGGESVENLASEMLALLQDYYPAFFACLDIEQATISRIDSTYSVRLPHERHVQPCIRFLSNISNGQRKTDKKQRQFFNTAYFGGRTSRYGGAKVYGKHHEMMDAIKDLQKRANSGCTQSAQKLKVFTPELIEWSKCLLRFESSTKRRRLEQLNIPVNLWDFIRYQQKHKQTERDVLPTLWRYWFDPILNSLEGEIMDNYEDAEILALCREKLVTITAKGKL